ncbi:DegT/DnrJ/EryC1/StrS family aminotransferase [Planctomycetota bacterium]
MKVPFLDLKVQYESIKEEVAQALQNVLDKTAFAGGPFVAQFEKEFAAFCQVEHAVGVSSGTAALWIALLGLDIGLGDEVITTANTFIATAEAISYCGARPVFVDVVEQTFNMDPALLEAAITNKTKAIIPVHLYGQPADMDPIMEIARAHKLLVIEDASQAHGAEYKGRVVGSIGDVGCYSFYPGKNLGAYGEAGAIVTNDGKLAEKMRSLCDHGQMKKYYHSRIGWNSRMDGFQGAILSVKLRHLPQWNEGRCKNAQLYNTVLANVDNLTLPIEADYAKHVYHIYAIRAPRRDDIIKSLAQKEIYCGIHYPVPLHLQEAYGFMDLGKGSFPVTEKCAEEILSLPMFSELSQDQIEYVGEELRRLMR